MTSRSTVFVAGFIGSPSMNMLDTAVHSDGESAWAEVEGTRIELPASAGLKDGQPVTLGIRPEHLTLSDKGMKGSVLVIEPTGSEIHVVVRMSGKDLIAIFRTRHPFRPGDAISLAPQGDNVHVFDRETGQSLTPKETAMLKGIDPRLNADVLYVLRAMGHGDQIVIADTNFPSDSVAQDTVHGELLRMENLTAAEADRGGAVRAAARHLCR